MKLLVLSNGHGEDRIAVRIIKQLQTVTKNLELTALPIVGEGYAYQQANIAIAGKVRQMPSGGFIYMGGNPLWQDLKGGLIALTLEQIKLVRQWNKQGNFILAVGDIVPLFYAWLSKTNYAFVGTAKSEYYLQDESGWLENTSWLEKKFGSVYLPWERWLMNRPQCRAVFPRDSLTAKILQRWSIPAYDLGNPMMDALGSIEANNSGLDTADLTSILLLPGSRMPEALGNWQQILTATSNTLDILTREKLQFLGAIAPALELEPFIELAIIRGWQLISQKSNSCTLQQNGAELILSQSSYEKFLQQANLAIAMAGTATEEFVGLGKPAIIFPGSGPQFTFAFAEAQSRLLGCSIVMVENPAAVGKAIARIFDDASFLAKIALNGKLRMGETGAAFRIARCLQEKLLAVS